MNRLPTKSTHFPYTTLFRSQYPHALVERAFEPDEGPQVGDAAGQLRAVEEHREWPLQRASARNDGVDDRTVLRGHLELRSEEHTSELQSRLHLGCSLLLEHK